jgi:hypothetical protein
VHGPLEVLGGADVERDEADHGAAQDRQHVRVDREQRHHENQGQEPWQHEEVYGGDPHRQQGIGLLVHPHRAELCREGRARPTGHDDARHQAAHLPGGCDGD